MIIGAVRAKSPRVTLPISGERESMDVEFIVDTGYTGSLSLPTRILDAIGAEDEGEAFVSMADGSFRHTRLYRLQVEWDGDERSAQALSLDDQPLPGFKMLIGYHLAIEMREGGDVVIEEL